MLSLNRGLMRAEGPVGCGSLRSPVGCGSLRSPVWLVRYRSPGNTGRFAPRLVRFAHRGTRVASLTGEDGSLRSPGERVR